MFDGGSVRNDAVVTSSLDGKIVLWNNGQEGRAVKRYDSPQHALALGLGAHSRFEPHPQ